MYQKIYVKVLEKTVNKLTKDSYLITSFLNDEVYQMFKIETSYNNMIKRF